MCPLSSTRIDRLKNLNWNYPNIGGTCKGESPRGFDRDHVYIFLGEGPAIWEAAKTAIRQWIMFPKGWTSIFPKNALQAPGQDLFMTARILGIWWVNPCRIVYTIDESDVFGFAYGTLPGHVERGEELFSVERMPDGSVFYHIRAFSRPSRWYVRASYPLARIFQRKFQRESQAAMFKFVQKAI
ncbi:MAG: DUF1990 family protein [Bacteroidetes bacterium]|nr:DUF1990 family protein [Bacteroidota bacterium]